MAEAGEFKMGPVLAGMMGVMAALIGLSLVAQMVSAAPPGAYVCPYCGSSFATYEELVQHVQTEHPGERIPIEVIWTGD